MNLNFISNASTRLLPLSIKTFNAVRYVIRKCEIPLESMCALCQLGNLEQCDFAVDVVDMTVNVFVLLEWLEIAMSKTDYFDVDFCNEFWKFEYKTASRNCFDNNFMDFLILSHFLNLIYCKNMRSPSIFVTSSTCNSIASSTESPGLNIFKEFSTKFIAHCIFLAILCHSFAGLLSNDILKEIKF